MPALAPSCRWVIASLLLLAANETATAADLDLLWSTSQAFEDPEANAGITHLVIDGAVLPDGRSVFLGRDREDRYALLLDPAAGQPDTWTAFAGFPSADANLHYILASDAGGIWLGGSATTERGEAPTTAVIVRIGLDGAVAWTGRIGGERDTYQLVNDAIALPSGELIVTGSYVYSDSYLAKIGVDGDLLWEVPFGSGQGTSVAALPDGNFLVAGFVGNGEPRTGDTYLDHVGIWLFDADGTRLKDSVVRPAFSDAARLGYGYGEVKTVSDGEEVYVVMTGSRGIGAVHPAVEVAKFDEEAALLWHTALLDTIVDTRQYLVEALAEEAEPLWFARCDPSLALAERSLLVACRNQGRIDVYKLVRRNGEAAVASLPFPECQDGVVELRLSTGTAGDLSVIGIPEKIGGLTGDTVARCAWLGGVASADIPAETSCRRFNPGTFWRAFFCLAPNLAGFPQNFPTGPSRAPAGPDIFAPRP